MTVVELLHFAVSTGKGCHLRLLLVAETWVNAQDIDQTAVLHSAVKIDWVDIVSLLFYYPWIDIIACSASALQKDIACENLVLVEKMLCKGAFIEAALKRDYRVKICDFLRRC